MSKYLLLLSISLLIFSQELSSQTKLCIADIQYVGNKRTKPNVIQNEINFEKGDCFQSGDWDQLKEDNENRLKSVGLFNSAIISRTETVDDQVTIKIELVENWYLYPSPIFDWGDRSFNVWWQEQGRSLDRLNYGARVRHYNLTGNKDPALLQLQFGYTRKIELEYEFPYVFKNKNIGFSGAIFYADNREIPYITIGNKPQFYQDEDERLMLSRFRVALNARARPSVEKHHSLRLEFHRNWVDTLVSNVLNPNYFLDGKQSIKFFMLSYDAQYDKRVNYLYPYKGYRLFFNAKKEGLGIFKEQNSMILRGGVEYYLPFTEDFGLATKINGQTNLVRNQQSFANNTGLGWSNDHVTGYDLYVLDGIDYILFQNSIRKKVLNYTPKFNLPAIIPDQFSTINVQIHLRFNYDFAYVNEPFYTDTNDLNNRWVYGFGPALDLILYNSFLFSFEYSFTDIGERGFFVYSRNSF